MPALLFLAVTLVILKAGGSLTEKEGGVISEFFVATDYSPLK